MQQEERDQGDLGRDLVEAHGEGLLAGAGPGQALQLDDKAAAGRQRGGDGGAVVGDGNQPGLLSLRQAVALANADPGPDVIYLTAGSYTLASKDPTLVGMARS
ncbi:MAG TPA: hypothetical protein VKA46_10140 [Gemmataceae bacterium]|nr:hypothetical protein [Gemmataceae bacterium]